jgi:hypothetical protein
MVGSRLSELRKDETKCPQRVVDKVVKRVSVC